MSAIDALDAIVRNGDEKYLTFTKLDAEGKPLWIRDARKNIVIQYTTPPVPNSVAAHWTSEGEGEG